MLENTVFYVKGMERGLRNLLENRKQITVTYYPSVTKGRVYKSESFKGHEIFFLDLDKEVEAF